MLELVFDTGGRDVELERIVIDRPDGNPVRLEFLRSDALPVKPCAGGPAVFTFEKFTCEGLELSEQEVTRLFRTAAAENALYIDAITHATGEHAPELSLLAVNELNDPHGQRTVLVDLTRSPLPVRPVTARMTVCLSDADEVRGKMRSVIKSALLDERCASYVSAESVAAFLTNVLMENGAWLDVNYPSLERHVHTYDDVPYVLERYRDSGRVGFSLQRRPCTVRSLIDGILMDPSCEKGRITVRTYTGVNASLRYDGCRVIETSGPLERIKQAFVDQDKVFVYESGDSTYWAVELA